MTESKQHQQQPQLNNPNTNTIKNEKSINADPKITKYQKNYANNDGNDNIKDVNVCLNQ